MVRTSFALCSAVLLAASCTGDGGGGSSGDSDATGVSVSGSAGTLSGGTDSNSGTTEPTGTATDSATDSASSGSGSASASGSATGPKFDVGGLGDIPPADCDCSMASEFGYIWVANSPDATVSKINTETVQEVGRYYTRDDAPLGSPSRTSVAISGKAVAVANRHGGLIKIWSNLEDCEDTNGMPGIQTSQGANDVLAWGEDECVDWYLDFPTWTVQRPVAWAPGDFNEATCEWENEMVWTAGCGGGSPGFGGDSTTHVHLVNGDTGMTDMVVDLADYSCQGFGPYGGAVDGAGNLWLIQNNQNLAFIDRQNFTHKVYDSMTVPDIAPYGLTVDSKGRPWVTSYSQESGVARFDPVLEQWDMVIDPAVISIGQSGITQGGDGRIWVAGTIQGSAGIAGIDPEMLTLTDVIPVPGSMGKGVSVDGKGFVWRAGSTTAARIHPDDYTFDLYVGLNGAYTYSDMTGFGVANASGCTPAG